MSDLRKLAVRIELQAFIADRPGQYEDLMQLAEEVRKARPDAPRLREQIAEAMYQALLNGQIPDPEDGDPIPALAEAAAGAVLAEHGLIDEEASSDE